MFNYSSKAAKSLASCIAIAALVAHASARKQASIGDIRIAAAKASGADRDDRGWTLDGTCVTHGAHEKYEFIFDQKFRFLESATGPLTDITGYDGSKCWSLNWSGVPHYVALEERDVNELVAYVTSGEWALRGSPLEMERAPAKGSSVTLRLTPKDGSVPGTMALDEHTMLPTTLQYVTESGEEIWSFSNYKSFGSRFMPTHITHHLAKQDELYDFSEAKKQIIGSATFEIPKPDLKDTSYNSAAGSTVSIKRSGGYMFVKPKVDGQDLGWFFLDSGADVMCLDSQAVKKLQTAEVGNDTTAGVVAVVHLAICKAHSFELGPVSFKNPIFYELDLADFQKAFGLPIAGICGYDFLARAVLDIDPKGAKISVYKPGDAKLPEDIIWNPITFNGETPCVPCRFEGDHTGIFSLDTGSNSSVDFFTPAVERLGLLSNRPTSSVQTAGAGGTANSRRGKISYFELGGHKFENPEVGFQITKSGVFASPYLEGNVGMGFLESFRLFFDYPGRRIGFLAGG